MLAAARVRGHRAVTSVVGIFGTSLQPTGDEHSDADGFRCNRIASSI